MSLTAIPRERTAIDVRSVEAGVATIALADTADGIHALPLARALANACMLQGRSPFLVLSAFSAEPTSSVSAESGQIRTVRLNVAQPTDVESFVRAHAEVPAPWICVGVPTLRGLRGALRLLLTSAESTATEREASAGIEAVALVLCAQRPSLAKPLIDAWLAAALT